MSVFEVIGGVFMIVLSIAITILVLMQESPKGGGIASLGGGSESFFNKNQGRTTAAMLARMTKYAAILFMVITIAVYALDKFGTSGVV